MDCDAMTRRRKWIACVENAPHQCGRASDLLNRTTVADVIAFSPTFLDSPCAAPVTERGGPHERGWRNLVFNPCGVRGVPVAAGASCRPRTESPKLQGGMVAQCLGYCEPPGSIVAEPYYDGTVPRQTQHTQANERGPSGRLARCARRTCSVSVARAEADRPALLGHGSLLLSLRLRGMYNWLLVLAINPNHWDVSTIVKN